ncbi:MAG: ABC transporter substrate-binding protein [Thermoplasmata archaeon]
MIGALVVIVILAGALGVTAFQLFAAPAVQTQTYPIGLAIAVTGTAYQTEGPIRRDAALLAIEQFNDNLAAANSPIRFEAIHEDTTGTAEGAQEALRALAGLGVKVVVGPLSTGETSAIRDFVTENKIVVISPSSTGVSAAIPNDFVFRAAPTDIPQAEALAQLVDSLGYNKVAVLHRQDDYGQGFGQLFEQELEQTYGGQVTLLNYDTNAQDLATEVEQLNTAVTAFGADTSTTAVLVVAFDADGREIFAEASLRSPLNSVQWFGSESMRRSTFLDDATVFSFIESVSLTGFFASPAENAVLLSFEEAYTAKYPARDPRASPYSFYAYDSAWMAMLAVQAAGIYDGDAIASVLPSVAERYFGASGHKLMDENGDAAGADYVAWRVATVAGDPAFEEIAVWRFATGQLEYFPGFP